MACRLNLTALALTLSLLMGMVSFAHAQSLPDPTRPPNNVESDAAAGNAEAESGLQSIIRPIKEKPRALINGQIVQLGGKVGDSRLVAINADNVVLMDPDGHRETLTLTPAANKSPVKTKPSASR